MNVSSVSPERCEITRCIRSSRQINCIQSLAHGPDLIDLHQDRVGNPLVDSLLEELNIGHEQIIPYS